MSRDVPKTKNTEAPKNENSPCRSSLKRTSTTMIIDGHVIKTSNNYVVSGDSYTFGAFAADAPKVKKPKPVKVNSNDNATNPAGWSPKGRRAWTSDRGTTKLSGGRAGRTTSAAWRS